MKSICLPVGMGLPIGAVTGMRVGRWANCAATLSAAALVAPLPALDAPVLDDELLPPHALRANGAIGRRVEAAAAREGNLRGPGLDVMGALRRERVVWVLEPGGRRSVSGGDAGAQPPRDADASRGHGQG